MTGFKLQAFALSVMSFLGVAIAPSDLIQYGALGLCAFMVFQNYRTQMGAYKVMDSQRAELKETNKAHAETIKAQSENIEKLLRETLLTIQKCRKD